MSAPVAVLLAEPGSLSALEIAAAEGAPPVVFVPDADNPALVQVAEALGPTVAADLGDPDACLAAVLALGAGTVTTFADRLCPLAARLRAALGQDQGADDLWGHKDRQRARLAAHGVSAVRSAPLSHPADAARLAEAWGLPLVVKPVAGVSSADTWLLRTRAEVAGLQLPDGVAMFAEEYLTGAEREHAHLGDYVSVEMFRAGPGRQAAWLTDRARPAWPCRETGLLAPSSLPAAAAEATVRCATDALDALGATRGVFHVEAKPAAGRCDIIEVNGRLGGYIARLARYGAGADLASLALRTAAGLGEPEPPQWSRCVAVLLLQTPATAHTIAAAPSRRNVTALPGVLAVDHIAAVGPAPSWRCGTEAAAAAVWLAADDHDALQKGFVGAAARLHDAFDFRDEHGRPVRDTEWLESLVKGTNP